MCKVLNCKFHQPQQKHACVVCGVSDSDHYASSCPKGQNVYHGTSKNYAREIQKFGFKASIGGRLGPGVYMTTTFEQAKMIAQYKFSGNAAVVEARSMIDIPLFHDNDSQEKKIKWFQENALHQKNNANKRYHPSWANIKSEFTEICIKDPKRIRVVKVYEL